MRTWIPDRGERIAISAGRRVDGWLLAGLAAGPVGAALLHWIPLLPAWSPSHLQSWIWIASFVILFPVVEETLFRGVAQPTILATRWGKETFLGLSRANVVTSVAFSLLHLFSHAAMWAAAVFLPSLVFGYFRDRHDSVVPAIALHVTYNACYIGATWNA